jgi:hypothetical protein
MNYKDIRSKSALPKEKINQYNPNTNIYNNFTRSGGGYAINNVSRNSKILFLIKFLENQLSPNKTASKMTKGVGNEKTYSEIVREKEYNQHHQNAHCK